MSDPDVSGETRWLRNADDPDAFWSELSDYPAGRGIRLRLRDGGQDIGSFAGTSDVSGEVYAPEPDGLVSLWNNDRESMRNYRREHLPQALDQLALPTRGRARHTGCDLAPPQTPWFRSGGAHDANRRPCEHDRGQCPLRPTR
jgi:hypothetical protein